MKPQEFRLISEKYQRHYPLLALPLFAFLFFGITCSIGVLWSLRDALKFQNPFLNEIIPLLPIIVFFIAGLFSAIGISHIIGGNIGYNCPNCKRQLAHLAEKIIPNGYCPYCGKKVLDIETPVGFHCPYCGHHEKNFEEDIIATGNCPDCGRQVIDEDKNKGSES